MAGIETKTAAGSVSFLAIGWLSTILIEAVPWLREHLTPDQKQNAPIILAWLIGSVAAYFAPHTHRPDLQPPEPEHWQKPSEPEAPAAIEEVPLPEEDPAEHVSGRAG